MTVSQEVSKELMRGKNRGVLIAELIDAIAMLIGQKSVLLIDEEGDGGCTGLFVGNAFVAENLIGTLDPEVQYEYFSKERSKDMH